MPLGKTAINWNGLGCLSGEKRRLSLITDDMDHATVPNIRVFTSNGRVIQEATIQGKLLRR
jgi:hypothetical protein